jgi:CDP-6-deoxy-D-xylo-4-hexulose-3-dehydrase
MAFSADRNDILGRVRAFVDQVDVEGVFTPGKTYIPPSGKVLDADDIEHAVDACLDMWLTVGRYDASFSTALAKRMGGHRALTTVSGSAANLLAFSALTSAKLGASRIVPGDEVITVAAAFPTTVAPIVQNGCIPVFCDISINTANIDVSQLEGAISSKTRAIMVAHTLGNPFDLSTVMAFAKKNNLYVIEDCCDALGAQYDGKSVGGFGSLSTLSFYPAHQITGGEGGAVISSRESLMKLVESFRDWGRDCWCPPGHQDTCNNRFDWQLGDLPKGYDHKYIYSHIGYNLKMTDMQAAIGLSQLNKVDNFIAARRQNWKLLKSALVDAGLEEFFVFPEATKNSDPSWFGFLITVRDNAPFTKSEMVSYLEDSGIGTRQLFAGNLIRQPAFKGVPHRTFGDLPNTDKVMRDSFWIGVWPGIDSQRRSYMVSKINEFTIAKRL